MLAAGIWNHIQYMLELRAERDRLASERLIHAESAYPLSMTLIVAALLLTIGFLAILSMVFRAGPFG
jgi:putative membrane protein